MAKFHTVQKNSANAERQPANNAGLPQQNTTAKTPKAQKPRTCVTSDSPAGDVAELLPAFPANGTPVSACLARVPGWHDYVAANFRAAFADCLLVPVKPGVTEQALQNLPLPSAVEASTNHHK